MINIIKKFFQDESGDNVIVFILIVVVSALLVATIYGSPSGGTGLSGGILKAVNAESQALNGN